MIQLRNLDNLEKYLERYKIILVGINFLLSSIFFILLFRIANQELSVDRFGIILLAVSICSVVRIFDGGIFIAATNWVANSNTPEKKIKEIINAYNCIIVVFIPVYVIVISNFKIFNDFDTNIIILLMVFMFFSTFSTLIQILLDALQKPLLRMVVYTFATITSLFLMLFFKIDSEGYIKIQIIFHLIILIMCILLIKKIVSEFNFVSLNFIKFSRTIKKSYKFQITNISSFLIDPLTKTVIGTVDSSFIVSYEAANQIFGKVKLLVLNYLNVYMPSIAKSEEKSLNLLFKNVCNETWKLITIGGLPFILGFPIAYNFLMLKPYFEETMLITIIAIFYYLSFFTLPFHTFFVARLKANSMLLTQIPLFLMLVIIFLIFPENLYLILSAISFSYLVSGLYHIYLWQKI